MVMRIRDDSQSWVRRVGIACLALMMAGCSGAPAYVPPAEPSLPRLPVRVSAGVPESVPRPSAKAQESRTRPPDDYPEDKAWQGLATSIQKIPKSRRAPRKGEKIYPLDLNLRDADLVEAVRVLGDTLGLNYTIDPRVKGVANVRAQGNLAHSELISLLESILIVNGATLIKEDNLYKIVPLDKASTGALPVAARGPLPHGMSAQVVFLQTTAAKELLAVLKTLMSPGGNVSEASHNTLIVVDYPANLEKILNLIQLIDSGSLARSLVRLVRVSNTDPQELVAELETIFASYGALADKGRFGVNFMPVPRLNSMMVLAGSAPLMERAVYWVRQLDSKSDMLSNVHVYHVENYKARNLADLLTQSYGGAPAAPVVREKKPGTGIRPFETQTISGRPGTGLSGGRLGQPGQPGVPGRTLGQPGDIQPGQPEMPAAAAAAAVTPLKERATPGAAPGTGILKEGVRIIPDEENNLLLVVAPPHEWRVIHALLRKLDIMPRQVLNEVLIAEVRLTDEFRFGIQWFLGARPVSTTGQVPTTTTTLTGTTGQTATATTTGSLAGLELLPGASAIFSSALGGFTFAARDAANTVRALINVLAAQGKINVLANPHIMAANNQEARIQIGDEVPILTSESVPLVSQATSFATSTVQYRSTGIILTVKPQINAKGLVTLDIAQEVSSAVPTTTGVSNSPTISIRQAQTSLITGDNQTIVLGGLIREDASRTKSGVPILHRMPLLGPLFGTEDVKNEKTELLVLITPHIVAHPEEGARITRTMKDKVGLQESPTPPPGTPLPPSPPSRF
ncbi:MAG: type II secretion system protein GspD [Deltaproteobacteria bacterium]|nr:type II secretion system protein GspD [Deltaproteobacteria bacterium]